MAFVTFWPCWLPGNAVRFTDLLKTTVLLSAGAASALAAVTVAGGQEAFGNLLLPVAIGWWLIAAFIGGWIGRHTGTTSPIATLLASARTQPTLPELNPGRTLLNRLWPLLLSTLGAGAIALFAPQVPAVATGFAIIWALAWRRPALAEAVASPRAAAEGIAAFAPLSLISCSIPAALLWPEPGAIWLDSTARENRPGRHGIWQRSMERRRLAQARLVMPWSVGAVA